MNREEQIEFDNKFRKLTDFWWGPKKEGSTWGPDNPLDSIRRYIGDGVFDISNVESILYLLKGVRSEEDLKKVEEFINKYPEFRVGQAYQCPSWFFLSCPPKERIKSIGSGFNYGSSNLIENCPSKILILAEDD